MMTTVDRTDIAERTTKRFNGLVPARMASAVILVILTALSWPSTGSSKIELPLQDPSLSRFPIAIPDFASAAGGRLNGRALAGILKNDLFLTGLFQIVEPTSPPPPGPNGEPDFEAWAGLGAQALVIGTFEEHGDDLVVEARLYDVALKRMELGKRYRAGVRDHRKVAHKFGDRIMEILTGHAGCFTSQIAFVAESQPKEICIMDFDGHGARQVTKTGSINMSPEWAPDCRSLLFTSYINRRPELFSLGLSDLQVRPVSSRPGINASARYSIDGNVIALSLSHEQTPKIFLITPQGQIIKRLTNGRGNDISPTWSPDGSHIAYVSDQAGSPQIYIASVQGGQQRRLTFETNYNTDPDWRPQGGALAFTARVDGRFQVCTIRTDGSDFRVLTYQGTNQDPAWSPDGRMIAFTSDRDGRRRIYIMDALGGIQVPVSPLPGKAAAWSRSLE